MKVVVHKTYGTRLQVDYARDQTAGVELQRIAALLFVTNRFFVDQLTKGQLRLPMGWWCRPWGRITSQLLQAVPKPSIRYKIGDRVKVSLQNGLLVDATVRAIVDTDQDLGALEHCRK